VGVREVVERYFACLNAEDWAGMRELWHDDAELVASGARPRTGPDGAVDYLQRALAPYAEHHDEPTSITVDGDRAIVTVAYVGRTHVGQEVRIDATSTYRVVDGRIESLRTEYDVAAARRSLG
jgi:ketosteroid isomerase-like protein